MTSCEDKLKNFAKELYLINGVKFGEFTTKIGIKTPVYCDLRVIVSHPKLMANLADLLINMGKMKDFDIICGVPYTALPIATVVSIKTLIPMVMRRKEAKDYGTKKLIEGVFKEGDSCLIIEDVVTSGSSILETVKDLRASGIKCTDALVLLNREQGGEEFLKRNGIKMHALLNLSQMMIFLKEQNCIDDDVVEKVRNYLKSTQVDKALMMKTITEDRLTLTYENRIKHCKNPVAAKLLQIMVEKQTNLCVAADLTNSTNLLNLAEQVGPHICALKTHVDIVEDFHINLIEPLKDIAARHNFMLLEDRKFADIGKTVELQYSKGVYQISSWADSVTVHALMGKGVLDALKNCEGLSERGIFVLAQASSSGNLISESYTENTLKLIEDYQELVTGVVCQSPLFQQNPGMLQLTPGVQLHVTQDHLGQRYDTPEHVILEKGADIAVVGRGIFQSSSPESTAENYKKVLWSAYLKRVARGS